MVSNVAHARAASAAGGGQGGVALPDDRARCRRTSPRSWPASTTRCATSTSASTARSRSGHYCRQSMAPLPRRRRAGRGHQAGLRVLRGRLRLPLPVPQVRPGLRPGVQQRARWRTPAASRSATSTSPAAGRPGGSTSSGPTRCCTRWRTCGSATWSRCAGGTTSGSTSRSPSGPRTTRSVEATTYTEAWTGFTNNRKNWAYRQDQLPTTHPIAADNLDLAAVEVNFDGITYAKGASALKQLVAWVGESEFLAGLRAYFERHAFGNSEFADLLARPGGDLGRDLGSWAQEWLQTARGEHAAARVRGRRRRALHLLRGPCRARPPSTRRCAGTGSASGSTTATRRPAGRARTVETDVSGERTDVPKLVGADAAGPAAAQRRRPHLRQDPVRRRGPWRPSLESLHTLDDSLARALCWGALWDMTRDARGRRQRLRRAGAARPRRRDRRDGRQAAAGVRRSWPSTSSRTRPTATALRGDLGGRAARAARAGRARAATTS